MKKTVLILATLLAAAGAASAGEEAAKLEFPQAKMTDKATVLDTRTTGSVKSGAEDAIRHAGTHAAGADGRQLGIDVSPWVMPVFH